MTSPPPPAPPAASVGPGRGLGLLWANLMCVGSMVFWCLGLPATGELIAAVPPLPLTFARMLTAGLVLGLAMLVLSGPARFRRVRWGQAMLVGGAVMGVGGLGMVIGLERTDPVTIAIITATMPIAGLALEILLDGRRVTGSLFLGLALGVAGGVLAIDLGSARPELGLGVAAALTSVVAFAWGSRATVRRFPGFSAFEQTAITLLGAAAAIGLVLLAKTLWSGTGVDWGGLGWRHAWHLFLSSVVAVALAHSLWIIGVGRVGVGVASMHTNASPFYMMVIMLALGGVWSWPQAAGAALVILGVLIAQDMLSGRIWKR